LVFATKYAYFKKRTMEPGEALSTAAQIAVALAGFAGVVVVFPHDSAAARTERERCEFVLA
jgi:hypothetical protein